MAEVPEVEIIVRDLREAMVGRTIRSAEVLQPAAVRFPAVDEFISLLKDRTILDARRRAKYILLPLSGDLLLTVHFALMGNVNAGACRTAPPDPKPWSSGILTRSRICALLTSLDMHDAALGPPDILAEKLDLNSLGPEALAPDFTVDVLARQLSKRRGVLKTVLLNQRVIAGLGNRDADESMWLAGIDPRRPAASLTLEEITRLHDSIVQNLNEGIALRGTQRDLFGRKGQAVHRRNIFEKTGEPCPRCGTRIRHVRIGSRNTHYCPSCQH